MTKPVRNFLALFITVLISLVSSCSGRQPDAIRQEKLFRLSLGKMEDQIDLFLMEGVPVQHKTTILMQDGLFYIGNGNSYKVMEFTSYGDLLTLYYNARQNPRPVMLSEGNEPGKLKNRNAYDYPFLQVGEIAVGLEKWLLVEERLPESRRILDEKQGVVLDRLVLRFSEKGELVDYLGQEGIGGAPFPYIDGITVTASGEIVVMTRTAVSWIAYWFSPAGKLLFRTTILLDRLPVPEGDDIIPSLQRVVPDRESRRLFLKLNYYHETVDAATQTKYRVESLPSRIYFLDVETGKYTGAVEVPLKRSQGDDSVLFREEEVAYLYEFLGAARGHLFLLSPVDSGAYELLVLNVQGRVITRKRIFIKDEELIFKTFHLSREGILSALLCDADGADVVWWRTDKLIEAE